MAVMVRLVVFVLALAWWSTACEGAEEFVVEGLLMTFAYWYGVKIWRLR